MWDNRYIISGGMYGGARCPARDLQILVNEMENHATNAVSIRMEGDAYSLEPDYWTWGRAYGLDFSILRTYIMNHMDNTPHEFELCELEIKNPEGAQYYKQSLVFWCSITATEMTEGSGETDPLKYCYCPISITKVCRRVYPTPYSAYVDTDLGVIQGGKIANIYRSGIKSYGGYWTRLLLDCYMPLGTFTYDNKDYFAFAIYMEDERADGYDYGTSFMMLGIDLAMLNTEFGGSFEPEEQTDPNEEEPPEDGPGKGGGGGGEGDHILPDEPVPIPEKPYTGLASLEWLTVYKMSTVDMNSFGAELVEPNVISAIKAYFQDPLDAIVGIMLCPVSVPTTRTRTPSIGGPAGYTWQNAYNVVSNEFYDVDCGYIDIAPYWDSFLDQDPYTRLHIFLPYIGYKDIMTDLVMGGKIGVKYRVSVITGECVAFVTKTAPSESIYGPMPDQVIAQFVGNIGVRVPTGRISHDMAIDACFNLMSTAVGMTAGVAAGASGLADPMNVSASQVGSQVSSATMTTVNGMKSHGAITGNIGSTSGYMGVQRPYIIRQIPRQSEPGNYKELMGYPCNKPGPLSSYRGTGLQCVEVMRLQGALAYDTERTEILQLLKGGVIV